jgi:hypothetical protein
MRRKCLPPAPDLSKPVIVRKRDGRRVLMQYDRQLDLQQQNSIAVMAMYDENDPNTQLLIQHWGIDLLRAATKAGCTGWQEQKQWLEAKYGKPV